MGLVLGAVCSALCYLLLSFVGTQMWVLVVCVLLAIAGFVLTHFFFGHRMFGGGANPESMLYIAVVAVALAVFVPQFVAEPTKEAEEHATSDPVELESASASTGEKPKPVDAKVGSDQKVQKAQQAQPAATE